jgi:hypothetical protein
MLKSALGKNFQPVLVFSGKIISQPNGCVPVWLAPGLERLSEG